jgi:hypothetical protein
LFELVGEKSEGIEFGEAVKFAKYAESVTGVRAAFICAIIHQESFKVQKFGGNVGLYVMLPILLPEAETDHKRKCKN